MNLQNFRTSACKHFITVNLENLYFSNFQIIKVNLVFAMEEDEGEPTDMESDKENFSRS